MKKAWLAKFSWQFVTNLNAQLCESGEAFHGPTSDGHDEGETLWDTTHAQELSIHEAIELCRRCHKIAPFCFFNGNTFAAIIKLALQSAPISDFREKYIFVSVAAHIVAGTSTPEEDIQFKKLLEKIT